MNLKEHLLNRIIDALEELGVSQIIIEELDYYLENQDKEEEFLSKLPIIDFKSFSDDKIEKTVHAYSSINKYKDIEYLKKYLNILFQMGSGSSSRIISKAQYGKMNDIDFKKFIEAGIDEYKVVALYSELLAYDKYRLKSGSFGVIYTSSATNPKEIIKAAESVTINAKMMIYSIYCNSKKVQKDDTYYKFLKAVEDDFLDSIDNMFENKMMEDFVNKIIEFIKSDEEKIPEVLINNTKSYKANDYLFKFLVGLSSLNLEKSNILKRFVQFFGVINFRDTFNAVYDIKVISTNDNNIVIDLDKVLSIPSEYHIAWYAEKYGSNEKAAKVLNDKFKENKEAFKKAIKLCEKSTSNYLMTFMLDSEDKDKYIKKLENNCVDMFKKLISERNATLTQINEAENFLHGISSFDDVKNVLYGIPESESYYWNTENDMISLLRILSNRPGGNSKMYEHCIVLLAVLENANYIARLASKSDNDRSYANIYSSDRFQDMFDILREYKVPIETNMKIIDKMTRDYDYSSKKAIALIPIIDNIIDKNREEVIDGIKKLSPEGRCLFLEYIFKVKTEENAKVLINNFDDNSKAVKEEIVNLFTNSEINIKYLDFILIKLEAKKQGEREVAIRILDKWNKCENIEDGTKALIVENLNKLLEVEKSQKIKTLIMNVLNIKQEEEKEVELSDEDFIKNLLKGNKKSSLSWLEFENLTKVKLKEKEEYCDEDYLKALLICYSSINNIVISNDGNKMAGKLNKTDLELFANEIFDRWLESGAESKKKWVLAFSAIYGGDEIVRKLNKNINEWPKISRGAIASEAIRALALNGSSTALLIVDGISRKFKFKQVKNAASEALDFAAQQMGLDREELSDKIVPNLDFDKNGERVFDYGERKFVVRLTPSLEVEVYDESEKKLKTLPSPAKKDDEVKAKEANTEFKLFKKQLKTTVSTQTIRLDLALSSERKWSKTAWTNLFVNNPIMHQFAIGLIWGSYEKNTLVDTFRYMEDGTFNTKDEEEFEMSENCEIGLIHPLELNEEDLGLWKEQLENYEIVQPVEQLNRKVYILTEEEKNMKALDRFGGKVINGLSLTGKIMSFGWYRGSVQDAGGYYEFYKEDRTLGVGAELSFEGLCVGYENEDTTIYVLKFYNAGTVERGSYVYDEIKEQHLLSLEQVPKKFFSEILYQVDKSLSASTFTKENWKKDK